MKIYFFRHGIASRKGMVQADHKRALTEEGRSKTQKAVRGLQSLNVHPDAIMTSPFVRAYETAKIACKELGIKKEPEIREELKPGGDSLNIFNLIKQIKNVKEVMLVGHEPEMSDMISEILSHDEHIKIQLKKSGICCVETDGIPPSARGTLLWLLTPKQLRKIG